MRWALVLALLPFAASANPFDGVYKQNANAECGLIGVDGGALEIKDGIFYGVESECRMTRPVNVVDMNATLYDMKCQGEGTEWEARAMFMKPADDGLIMVWDGFAFQYDRCSADELPKADAA